MNRFFTLAIGVFLITSVSMAQNTVSTSDKSTKTVTIKDSSVAKSASKVTPVKTENKTVVDTTVKKSPKPDDTSVGSSNTGKAVAKDTLNNVSVKDSSGVKKDSVAAAKNPADTTLAAAQKMDSVVTFSITIKTAPDSVAILMNDSVKGLSPLVLNGLKAGEYTFVLKKKGYYQKKVAAVVDSQSAKELTITLQQPGNVVITSDPAGAAVTFNGEAKGAAPVTVSTLKPGDYPLKLTKETFLPFEKKITITGGKTDTINCKMVLDTAVINAEKRANVKQKRDKSKKTSLILGIAFVLFAGIITIIDFSGNK
jgi:hypothetical protein